MSREVIITLIAVLAIGAFWAAVYFWDRHNRPKTNVPGTGLFGDLCRIHQLSPEDRDLLQRVTAGLPNPGVAFVDPDVLDRLGEAHPADAGACAGLRGRLFGG